MNSLSGFWMTKIHLSAFWCGIKSIRNEVAITRGWLFLTVLTRLTRCRQHRHFGFTNSVHQIRGGRGHCDHWCAGLTSLLQGTRAFDLPPHVERVESNVVMLGDVLFRSCRCFSILLASAAVPPHLERIPAQEECWENRP